MKSGQLVWSQELCVLARRFAGQQSSAVVDKTGKETAIVVRRIHFSTIVNKVESSLVTKTHASRDHHMLMSAFLPPVQTVVLVADSRV